LFVVTVWLLGRSKPIRYSIYAALFMLVTTIAALLYQLVQFFGQGKVGLGSIAVVLIILALFMLREVIRVVRKRRRNKNS
jgi:carbon starvation protein